MQDLVHDHKQVIAAPLSVVGNNVSHDSVDLGYYFHGQKLIEFNLSGGYDRVDYLDGEGVELRVPNSEILE